MGSGELRVGSGEVNGESREVSRSEWGGGSREVGQEEWGVRSWRGK